MRTIWTKLCLSALLGGALASAQKLDLSHLDRLAEKTDQVVNVTLDEGLIKLASSFLRGGGSELDDIRKILPGLRGIYVRSFEFNEDGVWAQSDVDKVVEQLKGWTPVIEVKSGSRKREMTKVMIRGGAREVAGLVILNASPREFTVVNIAGAITVEQLEKLGGHLGIPEIDVRGRSGSSGGGSGSNDKKKEEE
jgi:hypothetical protein